MKQTFATCLLLLQLSMTSSSQSIEFEKCGFKSMASETREIIPFGDNTLLNIWSSDWSYLRADILKLGSDGSEIWEINASSDYMSVSNVVADGDSVFYFMANNYQCDFATPNCAIYKYNGNGQLMWQMDFDENYLSPYFSATNIFIETNICRVGDHFLAILTDVGISILDLNTQTFVQSIDIASAYNPIEIFAESDTTIMAYGANCIGRADLSTNTWTALNPAFFPVKIEKTQNGFVGIYSQGEINLLDESMNITQSLAVVIGDVLVHEVQVTPQGNIVAVITNVNGTKSMVEFDSSLTNVISNVLLPESELFTISNFYKKDSNFLAGGFNEALTNNARRHAVLNYALDSVGLDIQHDVGVTDLEVTGIAFETSPYGPVSMITNMFIYGEVQITNLGDEEVDHFSFYFKPITLMPGWCNEFYYFGTYDMPLMPGESVWIPVDHLYHSYQLNIQDGENITLDICFNTLGPKNSLDDFPENDSFCQTASAIYTSTSELSTQAQSIYYRSLSKDLQVKSALPNELFVYNTSGQLLISRKVPANVSSIDISELTPGLYIASLFNGKTYERLKFVVEE